MTIEVPPRAILSIVGSVLVLALAAAVALLRPWAPRQRALIIYAIGLGLGTGLSNLNVTQGGLPLVLLWVGVDIGLGVAAGALLVLGASYFPASHPRRRVAWLLAPFVIIFLVMVAFIVARLDEVPGFWAAANIPFVAGMTLSVFFLPTMFVAAFASCALVSARAASGTVAEVREAAFVSTALALYPAFFGGTYLAFGNALGLHMGLVFLAGAVSLSVIWLVTSARCAEPKAARNAALVPLAAMLAGLAFGTLGITAAAGVSRILTVSILAYAILRHSALGIDAKLRFGISKGTIAAIFVAVFFIASEGAQQFFGDVAGSQYIGIIAAGALVFAFAPLQRAADRLASRALPPAQDAPLADRGAETLYRSTLRRYLRDGVLTREEEKLLAQLARRLGIDAERAFDLREEAEGEGASEGTA